MFEFKIIHLLLFIIAIFLLYHLGGCYNGVIDGFSIGGQNKINISNLLNLSYKEECGPPPPPPSPPSPPPPPSPPSPPPPPSPPSPPSPPPSPSSEPSGYCECADRNTFPPFLCRKKNGLQRSENYCTEKKNEEECKEGEGKYYCKWTSKKSVPQFNCEKKNYLFCKNKAENNCELVTVKDVDEIKNFENRPWYVPYNILSILDNKIDICVPRSIRKYELNASCIFHASCKSGACKKKNGEKIGVCVNDINCSGEYGECKNCIKRFKISQHHKGNGEKCPELVKICSSEEEGCKFNECNSSVDNPNQTNASCSVGDICVGNKCLKCSDIPVPRYYVNDKLQYYYNLCEKYDKNCKVIVDSNDKDIKTCTNK